MELMDAFEAVHELARMGVDPGGKSQALFGAAEDFWANNWENLEDAYGTDEKISALKVDGEFPEADPERLNPSAGDQLNASMNAIISEAMVQARDIEEVLIEGVPVGSIEAVNFAAAFWTAYGSEICSHTTSFDISAVMDAPGM